MELLTNCTKCNLPPQFFYKDKCPQCEPPSYNEDGFRPLLWDAMRSKHMYADPRIFDQMLLDSANWIETQPPMLYATRTIYVDAESRDIIERILLWLK